jgi:alpha-L-fucosidase
MTKSNDSNRRVGLILRVLALAVVFIVVSLPGIALAKSAGDQIETKAHRDARMKWWREARFGMFIHWGVYAVPAGSYNGRRIGGGGEWIMRLLKIPVADYKAFAGQFNPVKYDPDAWVALAKEAGMKYIVITAKHHDGFALFDSKASDWNVVDASPYGKDLLRPLEKACKKQGIKLGFYYSQAQDWVNPGGAKHGYKEPAGWDPAQKGDFDDYLKNVAYRQIEEILSNYDISILWWDTPIWINRKRARLLSPLLKLKPQIITNNRLGGWVHGDTATPEQRIPTVVAGGDWETCMTMNGTWGYKSYDHSWKSPKILIYNLVNIVSKGGNYLLNVGPKADGAFPEESICILKEIGKWMSVNSEAIYATQASGVPRQPWGCITAKKTGNDVRLYLDLFNWPESGSIKVPIRNKVKGCYLLADKNRRIDTAAVEGGIRVKIEGDAPDEICSVVVMDIEGEVSVSGDMLSQDNKGEIVLPAAGAVIHNCSHGIPVRYESGGKKDNIGFWQDHEAWLEWDFKVTEPGNFDVSILVSDPGGDAAFNIMLGKQRLKCIKTIATADYDTYKSVECGVVTIKKPGAYTLEIRPIEEGWHPVNLRDIRLTLRR